MPQNLTNDAFKTPLIFFFWDTIISILYPLLFFYTKKKESEPRENRRDNLLVDQMGASEIQIKWFDPLICTTTRGPSLKGVPPTTPKVVVVGKEFCNKIKSCSFYKMYKPKKF